MKPIIGSSPPCFTIHITRSYWLRTNFYYLLILLAYIRWKCVCWTRIGLVQHLRCKQNSGLQDMIMTTITYFCWLEVVHFFQLPFCLYDKKTSSHDEKVASQSNVGKNLVLFCRYCLTSKLIVQPPKCYSDLSRAFNLCKSVGWEWCQLEYNQS